MELVDNPQERAHLRTIGQKRAKARRIPNPTRRVYVKENGIYFTRHVLVDEETYDYVMRNKRDWHEPIGSVLRRLLMQKKVEGLHNVGSQYKESSHIDTAEEVISDEFIKSYVTDLKERQKNR